MVAWNSVRIRCLLGVLFALVVADGLITQQLIGRGLAWESNPLLRTLVHQPQFIYWKLAGGAAAALAFWQAYRRRPRMVLSFNLTAVAAYTAIVYWNVFAFVIAQV